MNDPVRDEDRLRWALMVYDSPTAAHGDRVAWLAGAIAHQLGWAVDPCRTLVRAARLHDCGKLATPLVLLRTPAALTPEERAVVQRHPEDGARIVACVVGDPLLATIIRSHHERWDGTGYPDRLRGAAIPWAARVLAVADVYDALRSVRPHKPAWPHAEALAYLTATSGRRFDPDVVAALVILCATDVFLPAW